MAPLLKSKFKTALFSKTQGFKKKEEIIWRRNINGDANGQPTRWISSNMPFRWLESSRQGFICIFHRPKLDCPESSQSNSSDSLSICQRLGTWQEYWVERVAKSFWQGYQKLNTCFANLYFETANYRLKASLNWESCPSGQVLSLFIVTFWSKLWFEDLNMSRMDNQDAMSQQTHNNSFTLSRVQFENFTTPPETFNCMSIYSWDITTNWLFSFT